MVIDMFLNELTNIKILTVLELKWKQNIRNSEIRPFHALSFRIRGNAKFICGNDYIPAESDDVVFVPKGIRYTLDHESEKLFVVHFDTDIPLPGKITVSKPHNPALIKDLFSSMYTSWLSSRGSGRYNAYSEFYRILSELSLTDENSSGGAAHDKLTLVTNHIHAHFRNPELSVSQLSGIFGTSDSYFRRAFTERYSVSPLKYINTLRLDYARELLHAGYYSVEKVAEMSGFRDSKYFSRFVKNETGLSPSEIKKRTI
ncbi:MAG: helix-turn-helix transcriptional regulator [Oscillospiraceae bacterium]|nr:helix-turn-helix transcriptional regulator [Oscillospiraceae bacterium]